MLQSGSPRKIFWPYGLLNGKEKSKITSQAAKALRHFLGVPLLSHGKHGANCLCYPTGTRQKKRRWGSQPVLRAVVLQSLTTQIKQKGQIKALYHIKLSHSPIWPRANEAVMSAWHA